MRTLLPVLAALTFVGCATIGKTDEKMKANLGRDISSLVDSMGPPSNTFKKPDGGALYTWRWSGGVVHSSQPKAWSFNGEREISSVEQFCEYTYGTDAQNKITSYRFSGTECRSR